MRTNEWWKSKGTTMAMMLLISTLILLAPQLIRIVMGNTQFSGEETYYHARMIEQIRSHGLLPVDLLQGTPYSFNLFHYLFAAIGGDIRLLATAVPIILSVCAVLLFFLLLKQFELNEDEMIYALLLLVITPSFMYSFSTFNPESFATVLVMAGAILFVRRNYLSLLFLVPIFLISPVQGLLLVIGLTIYSFVNSPPRRLFYIFLGLTAAAVILASIFLGFNPGPEFIVTADSPADVFTLFGTLNGYSIIMIGLFIIGLFTTWERSLKVILMNVFIILSFFAASFYPAARILVSLPVAYLAAKAVDMMTKRKWNLDLIKNITILLVVCSLVFSLIVFVRSDLGQISKDKIEAISYLSSSDPQEIILSSERNGFLIESLANRTAYIDRNSYKYPDYKSKVSIANSIYYSRNLDDLEKVLKANNITHLLVDSQMLNGEVWNGRDEGILFLFQHSKKFVRLFDNTELQIYRYIDLS